MPNQRTALTTETAADLVRRVAEQKKRKSSQISILEAARKKIRERGQFIPKRVKPIRSVRISL
jgi:hypothetical protein